MKGTELDRIASSLVELYKTLLHLRRSSFGKGDDKNGFRPDMMTFYQILDPLRGDKGLPGTRACQYKHRPVSVSYRPKLGFICILFKHFQVTQYPF